MALKGKQKNIDANKDGRISAEDFKIMRERQRGGMKKKMGGGLMAATKKLKSQGKMGGGMMVKPLMMNKGDMAKKTFFDGFSKIFKGPSDAYGFSRGKRFATIVGVKPGSEIGKGRKNRRKFKSLEEMRKAKGFKPGETPKQFNQRRMVLGAAKEAAKATLSPPNVEEKNISSIKTIIFFDPTTADNGYPFAIALPKHDKSGVTPYSF